MWGCPVYVLDPKLQDGHKIPKWNQRAGCGQYLGVSPNHSSTVGLILNHRTGAITTQYHVLYDNLYSTVPNSENGRGDLTLSVIAILATTHHYMN